MSVSGKRRNARKCRACGVYINPWEMPWVSVSITGEESHWHPECMKGSGRG